MTGHLAGDGNLSPAHHLEAQSVPAQVGTNGIPLLKPGEACPRADHESVAAIAGASDIPVWLPRSGAQQVTDAWTCGPGGAPILMFGPLEVSYEPGWGDVDIPRKYADLAADYGGKVSEINGETAYVESSTSPTTYNEVMLVHKGVLVRIESTNEQPISSLVDLAASLDLDRPYSAR